MSTKWRTKSGNRPKFTRIVPSRTRSRFPPKSKAQKCSALVGKEPLLVYFAASHSNFVVSVASVDPVVQSNGDPPGGRRASGHGPCRRGGGGFGSDSAASTFGSTAFVQEAVEFAFSNLNSDRFHARQRAEAEFQGECEGKCARAVAAKPLRCTGRTATSAGCSAAATGRGGCNCGQIA